MTPVYCQLCGRPVEGKGNSLHHPRWSQGMSLLVCSRCYHEKPRCRVCDLPMAQATPNRVCVTCSRHDKYCSSCGRQLENHYIEIKGAGAYCQFCYQERSPCAVCGAPLTNERWKLSDNRITCAYCHATAVYTPRMAVTLYEEMKTLVTQSLGLKLNVPTGLALVDRNQLADVIRQQRESILMQGGESLDLNPNQTLGLYARRGIRRAIYVQTGLPRMLFLQVAAHEYAHAWQGENCPILRDLLIREGFAEWIAYRVLGYYQYLGGQEQMRSREDIYGKGLRWALDLEAKKGSEGIIHACQGRE